MTFYAQLPARRALQVASDAGVVLWCVLWAWAGRLVHAQTLALAGPGRRLTAAGEGFGDTMTRAATSVDDLPVLGDRVAEPFRTAAGTGTDLATTGRDLVAAVERLALVLGWTTALVPILLIAGAWALARGRFVRRTTAARHLVDADADLDLFALRAMTTQPMHVLARITDDPVGAWRRRDARLIRELGSLELRAAGLRPPRVTP